MSNDGKPLEALVAYVEKMLLPEGFSVKKNERVFNDDGIQIAEFDIEIQGKVGSTTISWLIECRDRPNSGSAPSAWIEQLVGRRTRFGFNKITAVSTTGFAAGAKEFAISQGIELREVKSISPEDFDWLVIRHIQHLERRTSLTHASLLVHDSEPLERRQELLEYLSQKNAKDAFLRSSVSGKKCNPVEAFLIAIGAAEGYFDDLIPNGPHKSVHIHSQYRQDDYFVVDIGNASVRIDSILFDGEICIKETFAPLTTTNEYQKSENGEIISQTASFAAHIINGMAFSTELIKLSETGETHVILRRTADDN